ncbi:MAG: class I SAM-dependent methyltransferase [Proteobacteria bacterium]|jgi:SAM-dependent methyltransferase|nr:class I SAM-dependent methyltransferase [Pseudomonadota bacterium]
MDILTALNPNTQYSTRTLQFILAGWVLSTPFARQKKVSTTTGHVDESDYTKQSLYSLLYSLYCSVGTVEMKGGKSWDFTFNTWGYSWPTTWGPGPTPADEPEKFGKNAYTGLFQFQPVQDYIRERHGEVHVVEMGCGTGAGANHICHNVLADCTYEAVDMQQAAIETCKKKFVPGLDGRLVATHADCTKVGIGDAVADIVAVCETHVTEYAGKASDEDLQFFKAIRRILKPGGYLVWGNAIPTSTWQPCLDYLESIGMKLVEIRDVTKEAVIARDEDLPRVEAFVTKAVDKFHGFRIPFFGRQKRREAQLALYNFYRHPGTRLYDNMVDGTDSYKVVLLQRV